MKPLTRFRFLLRWRIWGYHSTRPIKLIKSLYEENGFTDITRLHFYVKRTDVRKFSAPLHYQSDHPVAKALYGHLFDWAISRINATMSTDSTSAADAKRTFHRRLRHPLPDAMEDPQPLFLLVV